MRAVAVRPNSNHHTSTGAANGTAATRIGRPALQAADHAANCPERRRRGVPTRWEPQEHRPRHVPCGTRMPGGRSAGHTRRRGRGGRARPNQDAPALPPTVPRRFTHSGGLSHIAYSDVVICGAGIAGVAAAYHLAVRQRIPHVVIVDERAPLSLTSDKSTEAYRNWWPGPDDAMIRLMNRSIDLLEALAEETGNVFRMNRRGYVYATADPSHAADLERVAETAAAMGAGPLRRHPSPAHPGYVPAPAAEDRGPPPRADLLEDPALIRRHFSY